MPTGTSKSRRRFVKSAGVAGVIGLAGCIGGDGGDSGGGDGGGDGGDGGGGDGGDGGGGDGGDGGGSTSQSSTDLRILSVNSSQGWQDHYNEVVSAWEEETNHTLEVQIVGVDQGIESVSRQLRAGDPPHLVHDQAWGDPGNFIAEGLTVPVEDITSRINGWDEIPDRLKFTYQGDVMNVPTDMILNMASVRRDLLEQAGINLDPYLEEPWNVTFEEWTSWAKAVDEHPDIEARGASFALATTGALGFTGLLKWAWGNDVTMWTGTQESPEIRFDQGDNVDKLTHVLETLEENYQYAPNTVDWGYSDFLTNIGNGNVAMGASLDPSIVAFTTATDTVRENLYGVGNPLGPSYSQWDLRNWTSGNSLVPMATDDSDVALDFIAWYMNSEVGNTRFEARPIHNGPVRLETYDSETFTSIPYVQDHPEQVNYYKHAIENDTHQPYSYTEDNLEWIPGLSGAYANGELGKMAYRYIEEGMSAEEAISQSAEQIRTYL